MDLLAARERASADREFVASSAALKGSPEMRAIARAHLMVCFACTLRNLHVNEAAGRFAPASVPPHGRRLGLTPPRVPAKLNRPLNIRPTRRKRFSSMLPSAVAVQMETVVGRGRIRADVYGERGAIFLLLHGIPGSRDTWRAVAAGLGSSARVIVPDLPVFGQSDEPVSFMHAQEYAASLLGFMHMNGLESVHLVGHDFGGPVACALTSIAPNRIKTLTLIATNVFPDTPIPVPFRIAKIPGLGSLAFRMMMGRWGLSTMWWAAVANKKQFPWSRYRAGLEQPGVWGNRDPFFSTQVGRRTARAIPSARYVEIAGAGHFVPQEYPGDVVQELKVIASLP
ncbi:MAG: alpha/beta hydrolase [Chloroflexota bacterium]|nr:alpha/beta hydrolase [Chloroflexota bacterium]